MGIKLENRCEEDLWIKVYAAVIGGARAAGAPLGEATAAYFNQVGQIADEAVKRLRDRYES